MLINFMDATPKLQILRSPVEGDRDLYKALSHPLRYRILAVLGETEASPKELSEMLEQDFQRVCEQVRILRDGGFIELVAKDQRRGGTQHFYKATRRPLLDADEWEELPQLARESISASVIRMIIDDVLEAIRTGAFDSHPHRALLDKPLVVDEQGYRDADASALRHLAELNKIATESAGRLSRSGEEGTLIKTATIIYTAAPGEAGLGSP
jgi:DNA-binding transcriptional ArsR family regulator